MTKSNRLPNVQLPIIWEDIAVIRLTYKSATIGVAKLTRDGNNAVLADIVIFCLKVRIFPFTSIFKRTVCYRGNGYGTLLLKATIEYCRTQGIKTIVGAVSGELDLLVPWYEKHGFTVCADNKLFIRLVK